MYLPPELDAPFRSLMATANRNNITFYSVDTRGVMTGVAERGSHRPDGRRRPGQRVHHDQDFRRGHQGRSHGLGQCRSIRPGQRPGVDSRPGREHRRLPDRRQQRSARPAAPRQRRNQQLLRSLVQSRHPELRRQLSQDRGQCQPQGSGDPRAQRLFRAAARSPRRRSAAIRSAAAEGALRREDFRRRQIPRRRHPAAAEGRRDQRLRSGGSAAA